MEEDRFAEWELALRILREAVAEAGIKDISESGHTDPSPRWVAYKQETNADVLLRVVVSSELGGLQADISLIAAAVTFMDEVRRRLNSPSAKKVFEFVNEEELDAAIQNSLRDVLRRYISFLGLTLYESLWRAANDTVRGYVRSIVQPALKDYWSGAIPATSGELEALLSPTLKESDERLAEARKVFAQTARGAPRGKRTKLKYNCKELLKKMATEIRRLNESNAESTTGAVAQGLGLKNRQGLHRLRRRCGDERDWPTCVAESLSSPHKAPRNN